MTNTPEDEPLTAAESELQSAEDQRTEHFVAQYAVYASGNLSLDGLAGTPDAEEKIEEASPVEASPPETAAETASEEAAPAQSEPAPQAPSMPVGATSLFSLATAPQVRFTHDPVLVRSGCKSYSWRRRRASQVRRPSAPARARPRCTWRQLEGGQLLREFPTSMSGARPAHRVSPGLLSLRKMWPRWRRLQPNAT